MSRHVQSRRAFLVLASAAGAAFAGRSFADAPETPDMAESAAPETPAATEPDAASRPLSGEWLAEDIDGAGVIDNAQTTLLVAEDGAVSGSGGCNRYSGKAAIAGETISFGPVASTRMACAEALMNQEQKFFAALDRVVSFRIEQAERKLLLLDADGEVLVRFASIG